ncbi:MAG: hypothetical protein ABTR07_04170 [Candidatus Competibacter denitrificans]
MPRINSPSPIKRRSRSEVASIKAWLYNVLAENNPMTVRQVFYQAVSAGVIAKTETEYKQTICRLLTDMRKAGELPWRWLADNTRWMRKPRTETGLASMLDRTAETYRRALWEQQPAYVEIWLEKDALAGVLYEETESWDVPLMVTRGYSSFTFLSSAAETIQDIGKPVYLYYFGDFDPSGVNIPQVIERQLKDMAADAEIHFKRVAVNPSQITAWNLPTRPTKKTDSRAKTFKGESVEVDAIPPKTLRALAHNSIVRHIDPAIYQRTLDIERLERETLVKVASWFHPDEEEAPA